MESVIEPRSKAAYFRDLTNSAEIYDEDGDEVELLTDSTQYYGENVQINVTTRARHEFNY
jgi:hypothetical protein